MAIGSALTVKCHSRRSRFFCALCSVIGCGVKQVCIGVLLGGVFRKGKRQGYFMEFVVGDVVRQGFGFANPNHAAAAICALFPFCWVGAARTPLATACAAHFVRVIPARASYHPCEKVKGSKGLIDIVALT